MTLVFPKSANDEKEKVIINFDNIVKVEFTPLAALFYTESGYMFPAHISEKELLDQLGYIPKG